MHKQINVMVFKRRIKYAKIIKQQRRMIEEHGTAYASDGTLEQLTLGDLKAKIRKNILYHIDRKDERSNSRRITAERAGDIVKKGKNSKWYFARHSTATAQTDTRSIKSHIWRMARAGHVGALHVVAEKIMERKK